MEKQEQHKDEIKPIPIKGRNNVKLALFVTLAWLAMVSVLSTGQGVNPTRTMIFYLLFMCTLYFSVIGALGSIVLRFAKVLHKYSFIYCWFAVLTGTVTVVILGLKYFNVADIPLGQVMVPLVLFWFMFIDLINLL